MALTESDLSELLAALQAREMTDTIRTSLEWILNQLIEAEATAVIGARPHERTDARTTRRYDRSRHNLDRHPTYKMASQLRRAGVEGNPGS